VGPTLAETEVFVAPFHGTAIKEPDWIPVTHGGGCLSAWSPDADALYFHSQRDGFHCIWAQQLNSAKHRLAWWRTCLSIPYNQIAKGEE